MPCLDQFGQRDILENLQLRLVPKERGLVDRDPIEHLLELVVPVGADRQKRDVIVVALHLELGEPTPEAGFKHILFGGLKADPASVIDNFSKLFELIRGHLDHARGRRGHP